ncbi:MAG: hypothetical protein IJW93_03530 [Clostridia bacterium]|nr:hypothetical protein [Clostridia bacterium]
MSTPVIEKTEAATEEKVAQKVEKHEKYEGIIEYDTPAYKPRKRRLGDRYDGRKLRTLPAMHYLEPYLMKVRADSQNQFEAEIDIHNAEMYLAEKKKEGYTDMSLLHVILAAYVRVVCERPGIHRFIAGQKIYSRNKIECLMTIKKDMSLESPDTCIKVEFDPRDNIYNVYKKFQKTVIEAKNEDGDFESIVGKLVKLPGLILRGAIATLRFLDYFGLMPKALAKISPFHGSMIITSMGSLGIHAIYHHLYDFGHLPIFLSYGRMFTREVSLPDGTKENHHFVTFRVVTDERICDGFYYASAFKQLMRYLNHPEVLDQIPETVVEDVD